MTAPQRAMGSRRADKGAKVMSDADDPLKPFRDRIASGQPIGHIVVEMPMKISVNPHGGLQFDCPMKIGGIEEVGFQRITVAVSIEILKVALENLENNPGTTVEVTQKLSVH
jgi:hypothetical protein